MSEPLVDLPYRAGYAQSRRAGCKSPFFDGKAANWHHSKCILTRAVGDFAHYDSLPWGDQEFIRKKIESSGGARPSKNSANGVASGGVPLKHFSTEYAKSGGSTCKTCEIKISKGAVRIGKKEFDSDRVKMYGPYDVWRHVDCFVKDREEMEFYEGGDKIQGIKGLKVEDIKILKKKIKKIERKRKAESESCDIPPTKKGKKEEDKEKTLQKEQNKLMFSYRDHLSKLEKKILVQLLEHNEQEVPVGVDRIVKRMEAGGPSKTQPKKVKSQPPYRRKDCTNIPNQNENNDRYHRYRLLR